MSTKPILMIGDDPAAMRRICDRVHRRRVAESNVLPALEPAYQPVPTSGLGRGALHAAVLVLIIGTVAWWALAALHHAATQP